MKKTIFLIAIFFIRLTANGWSTSLNGSISTNNSGLTAFGNWANGSTLTYTVTDPTQSGVGFWKYQYDFTVPTVPVVGSGIGISFMLIELSETFTSSNIKPGTTSYRPNNPKMYGPNLIPNIPGNIWGIVWYRSDSPDNPVPSYGYRNFTAILYSDIAPMWGNFYAQNGAGSIYAYNSMFPSYAVDPTIRPTFDLDNFNNPGNFTAEDGWVLVPDSKTIPEPGTFLLLGIGLLSVSLFGKLKRKWYK